MSKRLWRVRPDLKQGVRIGVVLPDGSWYETRAFTPATSNDGSFAVYLEDALRRIERAVERAEKARAKTASKDH